jgi:cell shape-determining protein MreC
MFETHESKNNYLTEEGELYFKEIFINKIKSLEEENSNLKKELDEVKEKKEVCVIVVLLMIN